MWREGLWAKFQSETRLIFSIQISTAKNKIDMEMRWEMESLNCGPVFTDFYGNEIVINAGVKY